jgi:hypothetical protein
MKRRRVGLRKSFEAAMEASSGADQSGVGSSGFEPIVATVFALWWTLVGVPEADDEHDAT